MGTTVLLSQLSSTTELLVINLVTQQNPQPDPQLSCRCHFRFPQTGIEGGSVDLGHTCNARRQILD